MISAAFPRAVRLLLGAAALCLAHPAAQAASADADWATVTALDAGPGRQPASREEAVRLARAHFAKQAAALRAFIAAHPKDPRVLDAQLRLTSIRAALGEMEKKPAEVQTALRELMALEKSPAVPRTRLPDVAFRRISLQMQSFDGTPAQVREAVVTAARNFANRFPDDKRSPRLLVEAATQCDDDPRTMRELLQSAQMLSREPALDARIADDMRRLESLGRPVQARFTTTNGRTVDLAALRGNVVVLLFWAAESPPSLIWMQQFRQAASKISPENLRIFVVSLDSNRAALDEAIRNFEIPWPVHFDGKGWENAVARPLGINAIPTVWILDKRGNLRTLNARESYDLWIRRLQREG